MKNSAKALQISEKLIVVAFPLAIMIGCAGNSPEKSSTEASTDSVKVEQPMNNVGTIAFLEDASSDGKEMENNKAGEIGGAEDNTSAMEETASPVLLTSEPVTHSEIKPSVEDDKLSMDDAANEKDTMISESINTSDAESVSVGFQETGGVETTKAIEETQEQVIQPARLVFNFATNKAEVKASDIDELKQHAAFLLAHPELVLTVNGHADNRGPKKYNEQLSEKRAQEVARLLLTLGVPESQVKVNSYGSEMPMGDTNNWAENRRVDLKYMENQLYVAR